VSADETVALARDLRRQMLRESVPPDIFVTGPDYAGSVGTRVLDIYGDEALDFLRSIDRATLATGSLHIRGDAPHVTAYLSSLGIFKQERQTGMICTDLAGVPRPPLPDSLRLSRVQVGDINDQLPTTAAFAAAIEAEDGPPPGSMLPAVLRMAARPVQLFAAVDREGSIQATSAAAASGTTGMLWGIGTMHDWRGQGVGAAMTAVAVHGAADLGATTLLLDATDQGESIYRRLGFTAYGATVEWHTRG
jgi:predicted GNAT family acetyltransferase